MPPTTEHDRDPTLAEIRGMTAGQAAEKWEGVQRTLARTKEPEQAHVTPSERIARGYAANDRARHESEEDK